jgi:tetratricopeptide (TPR) repeat protein
MEAKEDLSLDLKIAGALFLAVFVVYLVTLCPGIHVGPSAEAVCDVEGVGLTPPIFHPAWLALGRLFAVFSSNTAYMLNFMSALFGALTIATMYLVVSQFIHGRTAEEEARYQTQPLLRQVAGISASLVVAFSHPFWEGSVLAGSDTLNTFLLALIVFLVWRYAKTSKARYVMLVGLVYGIALANYPTLLLLAPIFIVFFLVRGRGLLDDPVAFVATFLLFLVGLLPIIFFTARSYLLHAEPHVVHSITVGQAVSAFVDTYFRSMKEALFESVTWLYDWVFWLFLPTFVPILFFMMKRGEYDRGSDTATRLTYLVRGAFVAVFTLAAFGYLWGFYVGPVGMAQLDFLAYPRYLGSYMVVGAWLAYILGYWMILLCGKFKLSGTEPAPKPSYRRAAYAGCVAVALALPVVGAVMSYPKSTKSGARYIEEFAKGILESCPRESLIVVPVDPLFGSIGAPLRYIQAKSADEAFEQRKTIIDVNAAYFDFNKVKRINTAQYFAEKILGREVKNPRHMFLPERPFDEVYDRIVWWERVRAAGEKERPRAICGLTNNFCVASHRAGNGLMNLDYMAEPSGLVYIYQDAEVYRDPSEAIQKNLELWTKRLPEKKPAMPAGHGFAAEYVATEYSKSANDAGVYCQVHGRNDLAETFYRRALEWYPENPSALWNLATVLSRKGQKEEAEKLLRESESLLAEHHQQAGDYVRLFGLAVDAARYMALQEQLQKLLAEGRTLNVYPRRVASLRIASWMAPADLRIRELIGDAFFLSREIDDVLATYNRGSALHRALREYRAAVERTPPGDAEINRRLTRKQARVYAKLGDDERAEDLFRKAFDHTDPAGVVELMEFLFTTKQKTEEVVQLGTSVVEISPGDDAQKRSMSPLKWRATSIMVRALLRENQPEEARITLEKYLQEYPDQTDRYLVLARELFEGGETGTFIVLLYDEYAKRGKEIPISSLAQLAEVYFRLGRYEDIVSMKQPSLVVLSEDLANVFHWKAVSLEALERFGEAEKAYEQARMAIPESSPNIDKVLNNLAWRYFKNGKPEQARQVGEQALKAAPGNPLVWDTYGWILYKTGGDRQKALNLLERAYLSSPHVGTIAYHYGKVLLETGMEERGFRLLERAVAIGLESPDELDDAQKALKTRGAETIPSEPESP